MKNFNLNQSNKSLQDNMEFEKHSIEINEKNISQLNHSENLYYEKNIKYILHNKDEQKHIKDKIREHKELKFKYAAIVLDKIFFYMALIYTFLTLIGLLMSM